MNILTGRSQEEEEAEAAALAKAKADAAPPRADADGEEPALEAKPRMVELRYGSYQGLQLSAAEVRRIKAEECKELGLQLGGKPRACAAAQPLPSRDQQRLQLAVEREAIKDVADVHGGRK